MYPYKFLPVFCVVLCFAVGYFRVFGHKHTLNTNRKTINASYNAILIMDIQIP